MNHQAWPGRISLETGSGERSRTQFDFNCFVGVVHGIQLDRRLGEIGALVFGRTDRLCLVVGCCNCRRHYVVSCSKIFFCISRGILRGFWRRIGFSAATVFFFR